MAWGPQQVYGSPEAPLSRGRGEHGRHGRAFVDKAADECARFHERERLQERTHRPIPIAVGLECERPEQRHLEPFVRPTLSLDLLAPGF